MTTSIPFFGAFLACFGFISFLQAQGQTPPLGTPEVLSFTKSAYQAGTQNWSIIQTPNEFIYFGNNKGIVEFDGTNWFLYQVPNRTIIRSLALGENGRIYVGAQDELGYLQNASNGTLVYHSLLDLIPEQHRSFEDVWKIFPTKEAVYYCARRAVFRIADTACQVILPSTRFENFFYTEGKLYAQDIDTGLMQLEQQTFRPVSGGEQLADARIAAMLPMGQEILVLSDFKGLFKLRQATLSEWKTPVSDFLKSNQAYCGIQLHNELYAIGTAQDGLLLIDAKGQPHLHLNQTTGLQNNTVLSLFQDQQNNIWLGLDDGIDYIKISAPFHQIPPDNGVPGTGYAAAFFQNQLFLGTNQGLFKKNWPPTINPFEKTPFERVNNLKGQVWSLQVSHDDLLISTHDGLYAYRDETTRSLAPPHGSWQFLELSQFPGYALEGTYNGLNIYHRDGTREAAPWQFLQRLPGFDESARILAEDPRGYIWVAHSYKGIYKIQLDSLPTQAKVTFYNSQNGLPSDISINVVALQAEIVFTTPEGAYIYKEREDRFEPYEQLNTLLGGPNTINRLLQTNESSIWFALKRQFGVLRVKDQGFLQEPEFETHYFNHLQEALVDGFEFVFTLDTANVFVATEKGFLHGNPFARDRSTTPFNAYIRRVSALNASDSLLLMGPATDSTLLNLASRQNALRFQFSSTFFEHYENLEFSYWLEGFEDGWSEWSHRTEKDFTNLSHGEYAFHLKARNAYGQVSTVNTLHFKIRPPWYASTLARIIYLILAIGLLSLLILYYSKKVEREKAAIVKQQQHRLEKKEAQFQEEKQRSAAEIIRLRNENLHADIHHKNAQLASATMHLVQKGEILLRVKRELKKVLSNTPEEHRKKIQQLIRTIDNDIQLDENWEQFEVFFDQVHENFLRNLRETYPQLTPKDQKLCAYLRMNLTTKEIAPMMNISVRGVEISRYRLRKKLGLDTETNLSDFIMKM